MKRKITLAAIALTAIAGAAVVSHEASARQSSKWMDAKPVGDPVNCITLSQIRHSRVRSDSVIDFYVNGNKVMRNTLPNKCPSLGFEERYMYKTSTSQLCSVDIITVLHNYGGLTPGAACGLGKFQQVEGAGK